MAEFYKYYSPDYQRVYYWNAQTEESIWEEPPTGSKIIDQTD